MTLSNIKQSSWPTILSENINSLKFVFFTTVSKVYAELDFFSSLFKSILFFSIYFFFFSFPFPFFLLNKKNVFLLYRRFFSFIVYYLANFYDWFKVQNVQEFVNESPKVEQINLELTKQTLNTMIDGFNRIKEQLNVIALAE